MERKQKLTIQKFTTGFTLVELLVTISIISLLASMVMVSLGDARAKARDAKRIAEIKAIQTALELYANDNDGVYPDSGGLASDCLGLLNFENALDILVEDGYLPLIPHDPFYPDTGLNHCYYYQSESITQTCGESSNWNYVLHFSLESQGNSTGLKESGSPGVDYCLTN